MKISNKFWYNPRTKEKIKKLSVPCKPWEYWDSQKEFETYYQDIKPIVSTYPGIFLRRQIKIPLTLSALTTLPKLSYVCDFCVANVYEKPPLFIEYKGDWVTSQPLAWRQWMYQLSLLAETQPGLFTKNFTIVGGAKVVERLSKFNLPAYHPTSQEFKQFIRFRCQSMAQKEN